MRRSEVVREHEVERGHGAVRLSKAVGGAFEGKRGWVAMRA